MMFFEDELLRRLDLNSDTDATDNNRVARPLRIAIYSHDAEGLGHLRRNLLVSRALLTDDRQPSILLISGLRESAVYGLPPGVDCVTLPSLGKTSDGCYRPRSLNVETEHLVRLRSSLIHAAVASFRPDVLIVDKKPLGVFGELRESLIWMREQPGASVILGLRDILDDPETVRREWAQGDCIGAMRDYYDRVWVYGDRRVYDTAEQYALPADVAGKIRYLGYLNPRDVPTGGRESSAGSHALVEAMDLPARDVTLCVIGGGRDGVPLATEFLRARLPEGGGGILVTGPLMAGEDRAMLHMLADERDDMRLIEFVTNPQPLMCCADRVISMGGYNTVCEVLAFQKRALIIPRVSPRREQIIRAERFEALGLLDMLPPDDLTAEALSAWIDADEGPVRAAQHVIDFGGVRRLPRMLNEALRAKSPPAPTVGVRVNNGTAARHV
ncbi:MAG TPA: glycosyltransferase [Phycisphaerales bacterium]|nr:glycosyltransferase [Phycisphaerales bacterium]